MLFKQKMVAGGEEEEMMGQQATNGDADSIRDGVHGEMMEGQGQPLIKKNGGDNHGYCRIGSDGSKAAGDEEGGLGGTIGNALARDQVSEGLSSSVFSPDKVYRPVNEKNYEIIEPGTVEYGKDGKHMVIVYNPGSGRRVDKAPLISSFLQERGIPFSIYRSTGYMNAFYYVKDQVNFDECSAIGIVGGDGTIHEVVNGMMHRDDKRKVPLAFMPNGSGNDCCRAFNLETVQHGLDSILKADIIKVDLVKILLDYKNEKELKDAVAKSPSM